MEKNRKSCGGLITVEECLKALKEFKLRKTPGTDGLPVEFYQFFWPGICKEISNSFNYAT